MLKTNLKKLCKAPKITTTNIVLSVLYCIKISQYFI